MVSIHTERMLHGAEKDHKIMYLDRTSATQVSSDRTQKGIIWCP